MAAHHQGTTNNNEINAVMIDHNDIIDYNSEQILPETPEVLHKLRGWLQPTPYNAQGGEYQKHRTSHVQGTGAWLASNSTYQKWLESAEQGLLWIKGIPGSGKSVMAANVIQTLSIANPGAPVLFFFFRQVIFANHKPQALLRDWMDQILTYSPPLQKELKRYMDAGRSIESLSIENLWKDLRMAFSHLPGKVFCVADALDEMDDRNEAFLQSLASLGRFRPEKVKVFMTSRPVPSIEIPLRNIPSLQLRLEEKIVDADISTFVQATLSSSSIPQTKWALITDAVPGRANGLFLYARLAMDAFLEADANIEQVLQKLPKDLNILYADLLVQHAQRSRVPPSVQDLILQTVTHATRPLRLIELAEMIRVGNPDNSSRDLKATKELIRAACGPLLEILANETISVIHHSFTEYLTAATRPIGSPLSPIFHSGPSNARIALECLHYLFSRDWSTYSIICVGGSPPKTNLFSWKPTPVGVFEDEAQLRLQHPFFHYAAENWHHHVRKSERAGHDQREITAQLRMFLGQDRFKTSQIHIASKFGLVSYVEDILSTRIDPNAPDQDGFNPIWLAASRGHAEIIRALIVAGANPDEEDVSSGLKPLHKAAAENHYLAAQALLESGVDPLTKKMKETEFLCGSARSSLGHTPLMYACQNGHVETVKVFLPFLKDLDKIHQALMWASESGRSEVVTTILQYPGVDANTKISGETPLFAACGLRDLATVKALLRAGADPNLGTAEPDNEFWFGSTGSQKPSRTYNCLHRLCGLGKRRGRNMRNTSKGEPFEILQLLVEAGVDIHQRTPEGSTALHGAVRSAAMTRALIDAGADVNAVDLNGNTPLHSVNSPKALGVLIEHGCASIDTPNTRGQTPLHSMLLFSSNAPSGVECITKFLTYGPDCNTADAQGLRPLHIAMANTYPKKEIVQALVRSGADPNLGNACGNSPLVSARLGLESLPVINALLDGGASINAVGSNGETVLLGLLSSSHSDSNKDYTSCIQGLVDRGANIAARDIAGRTALHVTIRSHTFSQEDKTSTFGCMRLDFLVSLGLEIKSIDNSGNGLLHELAERSRSAPSMDSGVSLVDCWEKLIKNGLDVDQKNYAGRTALHVLSATTFNMEIMEIGKLTPIQVVIAKSQQIDSPDEDGITPLHLAVTGSISNTKKLLDAGADPTIATHEGLTALHMACRARQSNVVGLLLHSLRSKSQGDIGDMTLTDQSSPTTFGVDAKANGDSDHITPLFYACRSGRPETVALLLEAGASINEAALQGCAGFEVENTLWENKNNQPTTSFFGTNHQPAGLFAGTNSTAPGWGSGSIFETGTAATAATAAFDPAPYLNPVTLADNTRAIEREMAWMGSYKVTSVTARLEEILDLLLSKQSSILLPLLRKFSSESMSNQRYYTARCFSDAFRRYTNDSEAENGTDPTNFDTSNNSDNSTTQTSALENMKPGESNQKIFNSLLDRKEYHLMEELARRGADFLTLSKGDENCNLSILVNNGFSSLLQVVGDIQQKSTLVNGEWHPFGDKGQSGLLSEKSAFQDVDCWSAAFLVNAVKRDLPNLAVVRLLVEKFHVDINEKEYVKKGSTKQSKLRPGSSALHHVAQGTSWWQTYEALPYLLKAGADIEVRNDKGQTPLLLALEQISTRPGLFQNDVVRTLLDWGADVNAVDKDGNNCLSHAKYDGDLLKLFMKRGAKPSVGAVFAAIDDSNVDALEAFLEAGFDPNTKRTDKPPSRQSLFGSGGNAPQMSSEDLPIYYACLKLQAYSRSTGSPKLDQAMKIVQILLKHDADPFSKFFDQPINYNHHVDNKNNSYLRKKPSPGVPEGYEERLVLHELMRRGEPPTILLNNKGLEINHRDPQGRTLLHFACQNHPDHISASSQKPDDKRTRFDTLLSLGGSLEARDDFGRNVLHYLIDQMVYTEIPMITLGRIIDEAPQLLLQSDEIGNTPLHHAVRFAAFRRKTDAAEALLSAGADALATTKNGDNMLHLLATNLDTPETRNLFKDLAQRGVDINARNLQGETPLFAFSRRAKKLGGLFGSGSGGLFGGPRRDFSETGAIQLLQSLGADFSITDEKGQGLLHIASTGDVERFKELMSMGLDSILEDDAHQTPIDMAAASSNKDVLGLFEKKD